MLIWLLYAFCHAWSALPARQPLRLLACLIIKMTKYLEKIINFVCMFGKIISRRYKVPFMSCLYLLSPSREQRPRPRRRWRRRYLLQQMRESNLKMAAVGGSRRGVGRLGDADEAAAGHAPFAALPQRLS